MKTKYKSVLAIDDHKMVANGIRFIIGDLFENFYMAYDGASGMSYALQHFPELIVVDYALPDTSGAGGNVVEETVVTDQNLITSRHPIDVAGFSRAVEKWLLKK